MGIRVAGETVQCDESVTNFLILFFVIAQSYWLAVAGLMVTNHGEAPMNYT